MLTRTRPALGNTHRHRRSATRRAFTLIEVLIVIAIVLAIGGLVAVNLIPKKDQADKDLTLVQMDQIANALKLFKLDNGFYPSTAEGINALIQPPPRARRFNPDGYLDKVPLDPWGQEYAYFSDGRDIRIVSFGADGVEGGEGYDRDLDNYED